jgi:hypothetical protein
MHADVHRRERQTNGHGRGRDDGGREDGQLQVDLRQGNGSARHADRVLTRITRLDHIPLGSSWGVMVVIAVLPLNRYSLRAVVVAMTV